VVKPAHTSEGQDIFALEDLLLAATTPTGCGVDLDSPSTIQQDAATRSIRYDGLVIQITITYQNVEQWTGQQDHIHYTCVRAASCFVPIFPFCWRGVRPVWRLRCHLSWLGLHLPVVEQNLSLSYMRGHSLLLSLLMLGCQQV